MRPEGYSEVQKKLIMRVLSGMFLGGLAVFTAVSLWTWDASDPQVFPNYPVNAMPANRCGVAGAYTASYLFYLHGLVAFMVPVLFGAMSAYVMLARPGRLNRLLRVLGGVLFLGGVSFLMGLLFRDGMGPGLFGWITPAGPGGVWGVIPSRLALTYLGGVGAVFVGVLSVVSAFFLMAPDATLRGMAGAGAMVLGAVRLLGRLKKIGALRFSRQPAAVTAAARTERIGEEGNLKQL
ncbi:MAG TPA: hypothetical protein ENN09_02445, partial [Planctomycetes bacterium]|nr:hypothetical protein [Planctomycetota bacterium]